MKTSFKLVASLAFVGCLVVGGCKAVDSQPVNPPPPQPASAVSRDPSATLARLSTSVSKAQVDVDKTLASLSALMDPAQADLRSAYNQYCNDLARMQDHAITMKGEADAMRASHDGYFQELDAKVAKVDNPSLHASADAQRMRLCAAYDQLTTAASDARDAYGPFVKDLNDIKKYLAPDLNKTTVAEMTEASKKVQADGAVLKEKLQAVSRGLDAANPATQPAASATP